MLDKDTQYIDSSNFLEKFLPKLSFILLLASYFLTKSCLLASELGCIDRMHESHSTCCSMVASANFECSLSYLEISYATSEDGAEGALRLFLTLSELGALDLFYLAETSPRFPQMLDGGQWSPLATSWAHAGRCPHLHLQLCRTPIKYHSGECICYGTLHTQSPSSQ